MFKYKVKYKYNNVYVGLYTNDSRLCFNIRNTIKLSVKFHLLDTQIWQKLKSDENSNPMKLKSVDVSKC